MSTVTFGNRTYPVISVSYDYAGLEARIMASLLGKRPYIERLVREFQTEVKSINWPALYELGFVHKSKTSKGWRRHVRREKAFARRGTRP